MRMDYSGIDLIKLMKLKMAYHAERQDVLAQNMANIDTPGYQAKDLKPLDFESMAMESSKRLKIRATSPSHITASAHPQTEFRDEKSRKTFETTLVKNNIVLEEQAAKIAENQMEYQKVTNLYNKMSGMFRIAIGRAN